jgi:hypothetical protein
VQSSRTVPAEACEPARGDECTAPDGIHQALNKGTPRAWGTQNHSVSFAHEGSAAVPFCARAAACRSAIRARKAAGAIDVSVRRTGTSLMMRSWTRVMTPSLPTDTRRAWQGPCGKGCVAVLGARRHG